VHVQLPAAAHYPVATVVTVPAGGGVPQATRIAVGASGAGDATVPFDPAAVGRVDLELTNGGHAFTCWRATAYSCAGVPQDDDLSFSYGFTAG
jgi:hypothetical protein